LIGTLLLQNRIWAGWKGGQERRFPRCLKKEPGATKGVSGAMEVKQNSEPKPGDRGGRESETMVSGKHFLGTGKRQRLKETKAQLRGGAFHIWRD